MNKKVYYPIIFLVAIVIISAIFVSYKAGWQEKNITSKDAGPKIVTDIKEPEKTVKVPENAGRTLDSTEYAVPLVPKNESEKVIVPDAAYTIKESYQFSVTSAKKWSPDAKLISVRSLGTVTLEGRSNQWQLLFGSANKKGGYEIIVRADKIYSEKSVPSNIYGFALPQNWFDSPDAIASITTLSQFSDATMSSISFYYNTDGRNWSYAVQTSKGVTSMQVR